MVIQVRRETLVCLFVFIAIISICLFFTSSRFNDGFPLGIDSPSHLYKVLHIYKTFTSHEYVPSWCSDWYGGIPFLYFYPPLAYLMTFFIALFGLGPVLAYKLVETCFYVLSPFCIYFLSRELGFKKFQSLFASLCFSLAPVVIENFIFFDRFTTIISVPFICLFLITLSRALKSQKHYYLASSSFLLTILILIHHLSAYYLGIILFFLAAAYYFKTNNAKTIAKKVFLIVAPALLLSAFWLFPFLSSIFSRGNPFYNRSIVDNFILPEQFLMFVQSIGLIQLFFALSEITFYLFPSVQDLKTPINLFKLLFPSTLIVIGSLVSYWIVEVGQLLFTFGFITFFISFFNKTKARKVKETGFVFCIFWFIIFLWLGFGYYALLIRFIPFSRDLDVLRFTFYLTIPQSILAGNFIGRVLSNTAVGGLRKTIFRKKTWSTVLVLCIFSTLFVNLYLVKDTCNLTPSREFTRYEANIPQKIIDFFSLNPQLARILAIKCPDWIYLLPIYSGKPIIDGWYPQAKILKPLLQINDYQINTLNTYNEKERLKLWGNLIGNSSRLGINWVIVGELEYNSIMDNYPNFKRAQIVENLTIYAATPPVSLVEVNPEYGINNISINYISPGRIILKADNLNKPINITVKEADFKGWNVFIDDIIIDHSQNEDGFITFQLEANTSQLIRINYEKQGGLFISLMAIAFVIAPIYSKLVKSIKKRRSEANLQLI